MTPSKASTNKYDWTTKDSSILYGLDRWGKDYFSINESGNILITPKDDKSKGIDLLVLLKELEGRNLKLPLLVRFDDILENRLDKIHQAFGEAISKYKYQNHYQGVFPIKCNQQRQVVEKIITYGQKWKFGLEAGSKAELLIALSLIDDPMALLICNGYKDMKYIETAILARQLGKKPVVVIEQFEEVERIIAASKKLGADPLIGIRAKLSSQSSGRWGSSTGESSKFGLSMPDIVKAIKKLKDANLLQELKLLHFHLGSQINDIAILKDALQEAGHIYIELNRFGAPMGYLDVGGGLGVDYDGSKTASAASTNYSLQNYANDVVANIQECCESHDVKVPTLISESGRAISSHYSILIFNVLGSNSTPLDIPKKEQEESLPVQNLRETLNNLLNIVKTDEIDFQKLQEAWNDALKFKDDALTAFRLGYLNLTERALAEQITLKCAYTLATFISDKDDAWIPKELTELNIVLSETYYANLSIFRSAPDTWAIEQLFPVMPIHRLDEKPTRLGHFADLTCDSDGRLAKFINNGQSKDLLELHQLKPKEDYWIGVFLSGAYQEVMGNLHNLFGTTNAVHIRLTDNGGYQVEHVIRGASKADVLKAMEHEPQRLLEKLRMTSEKAIQDGQLKINDAQRLMDHIENSLRQSTYLQD